MHAREMVNSNVEVAHTRRGGVLAEQHRQHVHPVDGLSDESWNAMSRGNAMSQLECDFWVTGRQHPIATADQHLTEQHGHRAGHTARAAVQSKGEQTEALAKWRKPKPKSRIPGKKEAGTHGKGEAAEGWRGGGG